MVRFRFRIRVKDRVRVGMVFRVRVRFPLSTLWREAGGNLSKSIDYLVPFCVNYRSSQAQYSF